MRDFLFICNFFFINRFIGGFGIPTDLAYESLTIGYVLKVEFCLSWNSMVFYENHYLPEPIKYNYLFIIHSISNVSRQRLRIKDYGSEIFCR